MKTRTLFLALISLLIIGLITACTSQPADIDQQSVTDYASLVKALESAGAKVEPSDSITQPFFGPEGKILKVNSQDIQVFEYPDEATAERDAQSISPDGSSSTTTMIAWIEPPHFYRSGQLIILYVGSDVATTQLLESLIGPQFAGQ